ncbi:NADH dehydrogenase [ubiquinone] 1 alpha subcomplex subunit 5 isoform X2 [Girardinichthys multiradiatus]|uniref:NADH dehydrogenase [ubiquinone] 1 alpha subcomplex subunit 5 isoform X2 n=1 Tax=Girardinichthys multiradiatus TaxID=208333 RepID=UPI001FAD8968|nr:NADH dehydrogenase [ubiquinone] 1 alpha subcomplex subunit 5 isoform X2 [Girardinichthys multiradiatus]
MKAVACDGCSVNLPAVGRLRRGRAKLTTLRQPDRQRWCRFHRTTGLVGLAVSQNPHERLRILYSKILASLQTMPQDAVYRRYTEQLVKERFDHVKTEPDVEKLEKKINGGQIEEVIFQAESELALSRKMANWKPWEPMVEEPPPNQWKWPI